MRKIAVAIVFALLSTQCPAQGTLNGDQCEQVRAAIAQHGLQAARQHAMENYGLAPADLRRIEHECGVGIRDRRINRGHRRGRMRA